MDKQQIILYTPALRGCFFILRAAEGTPGRVPCEIMSAGAPRGAPRRLPLLSRRRGASFFSSVSPRGCPRALPFSAVVPLPILTAFVFPFFPRFFLSAVVPAFPLSRFPAFPLSRFPAFPLSRFPASNPFRFCRQKQRGGAVFSAPPRGNDVIFLFCCSPLHPTRAKSPSAGRRVTDSRLLPRVGIVL